MEKEKKKKRENKYHSYYPDAWRTQGLILPLQVILMNETFSVVITAVSNGTTNGFY